MANDGIETNRLYFQLDERRDSGHAVKSITGCEATKMSLKGTDPPRIGSDLVFYDPRRFGH